MSPLLSAAVTAALALVLMEPFTYAAHRWVMHGFGERWHRSHHQPATGGWERNDLYPVVFAGAVLMVLVAGFNVPGLGSLVAVGVGVTVYGAAYALVHDVYIHGRLGWFGRRRWRTLDRLAAAHRIHHLYNGEPYGMLMPIVPAALRQRAERTERDPIARVTR